MKRLPVFLTYSGSIVLLEPLTPEAVQWCEENLPEDAPMLGRAYAIEPRYLDAILDGIETDLYGEGAE